MYALNSKTSYLYLIFHIYYSSIPYPYIFFVFSIVYMTFFSTVIISFHIFSGFFLFPD